MIRCVVILEKANSTWPGNIRVSGLCRKHSIIRITALQYHCWPITMLNESRNISLWYSQVKGFTCYQLLSHLIKADLCGLTTPGCKNESLAATYLTLTSHANHSIRQTMRYRILFYRPHGEDLASSMLQVGPLTEHNSISAEILQFCHHTVCMFPSRVPCLNNQWTN